MFVMITCNVIFCTFSTEALRSFCLAVQTVSVAWKAISVCVTHNQSYW